MILEEGTKLVQRRVGVHEDGKWGLNTLAAVMNALGVEREHRPDSARASEPRWLAVARPLMGTKEIPGPQHASFIAKGWARLGASWFNDDETPWCGLFIAHCFEAVKIPYPGKGEFARARAWLGWGEQCPLLLGAVAVFGREGGGHVGFVVGQSAANLYILGGNQSNMVSIAPIARSRLLGLRWPAGEPRSLVAPPSMSGGAVSRNEA